MNLRNKNILAKLDYDTLVDISIKEQKNRKENKINIYYDLTSKEAIIYPEDDNVEIKLRPLHTRLLSNGTRFATDVSKYIAKIIEIAIETNDMEKMEECLKENQ